MMKQHWLQFVAWLCCLLLGAAQQQATAQLGISNVWTMGYDGGVGEDSWGEPFGGENILFSANSREIFTQNRWMDYGRTVANISDPAGALLFSSNGVYVGDSAGNLMQNGDSLNPSFYASQYTNHPAGIHIPQGCLILPKPAAPGIYYLFHGTIDDAPTFTAHYLYLTTINMNLNDGLGAVVAKNQVVLSDTLNPGRITAVRHANGRDWWLFCHKDNTNMYDRLLVTPTGVEVDGTQAIGIVRYWDIGSVCFSPDGSRFAYIANNNGFCRIDLFDFDRCTGLFSNPLLLETPDTTFAMGVAFSPNSRFLYATATWSVYQFDTEAPDIQASRVHLAHWDSTYSPSPPFAALFDMAQLAPDGKIYISTGNSGLVLHVINNPDSAGLACGMVQHGVELPRLNMNSLPNHPNYHLGAVEGSVCDSLGLSALTPGPSPRERGGVRASPNPTTGQFTLSYPAHAREGWLLVRNLAGQLVLRERLPQWSTIHEVELQGHAAGMYQCSLRWGVETTATRVILTER